MNRQGLIDAVVAYTGKPEVELAVPTFIVEVEAQANRKLRVRAMIGRDQGSLANEFVTVPDDFIGVRTFELDTTPVRALEYLAPDQLAGKRGHYQTAGQPYFYSIVGGEFRFMPEPGDYTGVLTYWQSIPALATDNTTNWLLTAHPDAYLQGCLARAFAWLGDGQREMMAQARFEDILAEIQRDDASQSYGATLQTSTSLVV